MVFFVKNSGEILFCLKFKYQKYNIIQISKIDKEQSNLIKVQNMGAIWGIIYFLFKIFNSF